METGLADKVFIKKYVPSAIVRFEKIQDGLENANLSLDIGCSIGVLTSEVAKKSKTTIGIEIRKDAIKIAKRVAPSCLFVVADGTALPFKNSVFEQVLSSEVIEHIKDFKKYLLEISRVSKKMAAFILTTPNRIINFPAIGPIPSPSLSWIIGKMTSNPLFLYPYGHYYGGFSPGKLKKELESAGFKNEKTDYCGFSIVKLMDDITYIFAVKKKTLDDIDWFNRPDKKSLATYKKFLPAIRKLIKIDNVFLKLGFQGYIIFLKSRKT